MKIILVGGGTAGHINPALALADYIKEKDPKSKILYVGAKGKMEEKLVSQSGFEFKGITVSGFYRKLSFESFKKNIQTLKNIVVSTLESKKIIKDFAPDICIGTGGYVCGSFLREAAQLKIPFLIHDSNSYPGITTKLLAKKASRVLLANSKALKYLPKSAKCIITGTPVRKKIINFTKSEARKNLGVKNNLVVLSFGGSLGAKAINTAVAKMIIEHKNDSSYTYIHGFGKSGQDFKDALRQNGIDVQNDSRYLIKEYITNMPECLAAADIVICRAGATTISELQAARKPAILIPSPNVAENHQYHNAMALVDENAASIIQEKDLTPENLWKEIQRILGSNSSVANKYCENLKRIATTNSNEKIYKIMENVVNGKEEIL